MVAGVELFEETWCKKLIDQVKTSGRYLQGLRLEDLVLYLKYFRGQGMYGPPIAGVLIEDKNSNVIACVLMKYYKEKNKHEKYVLDASGIVYRAFKEGSKFYGCNFIESWHWSSKNKDWNFKLVDATKETYHDVDMKKIGINPYHPKVALKDDNSVRYFIKPALWTGNKLIDIRKETVVAKVGKEPLWRRFLRVNPQAVSFDYIDPEVDRDYAISLLISSFLGKAYFATAD